MAHSDRRPARQAADRPVRRAREIESAEDGRLKRLAKRIARAVVRRFDALTEVYAAPSDTTKLG